MVVIAKDDDVQIERLELGPFGTNAYIVICRKTRDSALIDAPAEASTIMNSLASTNPRYILLTHDHMDHIGALAELHSRLKVPLAVHALDARNLPSSPEMRLNDGDTISLGNLKLAVLHTPGHTPGHVCFYEPDEGALFDGDVLFYRGIGRTDLPGGSWEQLSDSIRRVLFELPDETVVYSGHGPATTIGDEKRLNPWMQ